MLRTTIHDLLSRKGRRAGLQLPVEGGAEAAAAVEAGIPVLSREADATPEAVQAVAPSALIATGLAHGSVAAPMITMGTGWGTACDTQDLVSRDVPGPRSGPTPRPARRCDDLAGPMAEVRARRPKAFQAWAADVESGAHPEARHRVGMTDGAWDRILTLSQPL